MTMNDECCCKRPSHDGNDVDDVDDVNDVDEVNIVDDGTQDSNLDYVEDLSIDKSCLFLCY